MTTGSKPRFWLAGLGLAMWSLTIAAESDREGLQKVDHIVVIVLENHSFDNLYGLFPGASGIAAANSAAPKQTDRNGRPYEFLPPVLDTRSKPPIRDPRFPAQLPNQPFEIDRYVPGSEPIGDLTHGFFQHQAQINHGRNDRFAAVSDAGGLAMGYYDGRDMRLWSYAKRFTLADHFFQSAYGGSFLNHLWLICACTPRHPNPPRSQIAIIGGDGELIKNGALMPDGYAVNTMFPFSGPHSLKAKDPDRVLPPLEGPTIGDRLSDKNISWAWYSGGWNDAVAGQPDPSFQFHHQPFAYFRRYGEGTPGRKEHLRDEAEFRLAIRQGTLPAVSFYKPLGRWNEHPGYTDLVSGDRHVADILGELERSPLWSRLVVVVTYDEYGGFWDHVSPPKGDRWGPGSRVPTLIISPFSVGGVIDHRTYETTSILRFIEHRFGLEALGDRDARAADLSEALRLGGRGKVPRPVGAAH